MSTPRDRVLTAHDGLALLCIEWLIQDHLVAPHVLWEKLACPTNLLYEVLASLTEQEIQALRRSISKAAATNSLPGPLHPRELFHFLDSIGAPASPPTTATPDFVHTTT